MEYIQFEAEDSDQNWQKNDEEEVNFLAEDDDFIDEESVKEESEEPAFYRFINQTRDLNEALNCDDGSCLHRRDLQPEKFIAEVRENVDFDEFDERAKLSGKLKRLFVNLKILMLKILFWCCFIWSFD